MKHYLLLRFPHGFLSDELYRNTQELFAQLACQIAGIKQVRVSRNCIPRESNMDLMVELDLAGPEVLDHYLNHALHKYFIQQTGIHAIERNTFDREE